MIKIIHPVEGAVAILTIATFWLSTAIAELFASPAVVTAVKTAIPWSFLLLIPALAAAGGSGFILAKGRRTGLIGTKIKRMLIIAANGILVLIPSALYLASKAKAGELDTAFYAVQALELAAGCGESHASRTQHPRSPQNDRPLSPQTSMIFGKSPSA